MGGEEGRRRMEERRRWVERREGGCRFGLIRTQNSKIPKDICQNWTQRAQHLAPNQHFPLALWSPYFKLFSVKHKYLNFYYNHKLAQ